jgi:hypothetical protein
MYWRGWGKSRKLGNQNSRCSYESGLLNTPAAELCDMARSNFDIYKVLLSVLFSMLNIQEILKN